MDDPIRPVTRNASRRTRRSGNALRPPTLDEYVGQERLRQNLKVFIEAATPPGRAPRPRAASAALRGSGKTTLAYIIAHEMGVGDRDHLRPDPRTRRRPRRDAHEPQRRRRALHRRDPPPQPGGGGGPLPRDGGLPARHHDRPGAQRPHHQDRPAAVHPGGRHDALGAAHRAAARPLRGGEPARVLLAGGAGDHRAALRPASSTCGSPTTAAGRWPAAAGAPRGSPTACCKRVRDFAEVRHAGWWTGRWPIRLSRARGGRGRGSTAWTAASSRSSSTSSPGGPVGIDTLAASVSEQKDTHRGRVRALPDPGGVPVCAPPAGSIATEAAYRHFSRPSRPQGGCFDERAAGAAPVRRGGGRAVGGPGPGPGRGSARPQPAVLRPWFHAPVGRRRLRRLPHDARRAGGVQPAGRRCRTCATSATRTWPPRTWSTSRWGPGAAPTATGCTPAT